MEAELVDFFQFSLEMLCIASGDGYFKRVNPAFERILGHSADEVLSRPFADFIHPEDQEKTKQELRSWSRVNRPSSLRIATVAETEPTVGCRGRPCRKTAANASMRSPRT